MKKPSLLLLTTKDRPDNQALDLKLLRQLKTSPYDLIGVVSNADEDLHRHCRHLDLPFFTPDHPELQDLKPDVGLAYFAQPNDPGLQGLPVLGWLEFQSGPASEIETILAGGRHINGLVTGPNLRLFTNRLPVKRWDTPLSLRAKVAAKAAKLFLKAVKLLLKGRTRQASDPVPSPAHLEPAALYALSRIQWSTDSHQLIHRRFQAFRGIDLGISLKAEVEGRLMEIQGLELHPFKDAPGTAGLVIGSLEGRQIIRTTEGLAVLTAVFPFRKTTGTAEFIDHRNDLILAPNRFKPEYTLKKLRNRLRKPGSLS